MRAIFNRLGNGYFRGCSAGTVSRSTIAKIEAGLSIPSTEMMIRLANTLKLRLPTLLLKVGVIGKHDTVRALTEVKNGNAGRLLKRKI